MRSVTTDKAALRPIFQGTTDWPENVVKKGSSRSGRGQSFRHEVQELSLRRCRNLYRPGYQLMPEVGVW